jgi:tetratricopeptide (TPR) repeat protein
MTFFKTRQRPKSPNPLAWVCVLGLALALCLTGGLVFLAHSSGTGLFPPPGRRGGDFFTLLRDYDEAAGSAQAVPDELDRRLTELEKKALGVETHLSVLKRRRSLARIDPRFWDAYIRAVYRGAELFPFSEPLAAAAGEALIREGTTDSERALGYAELLQDEAFLPLSLSLYGFSGALEDPARAAAVPHLPELLSLAGGSIPERYRAPLFINAVLLHLLRGDKAAALDLVQTLSAPGNAVPEFRRFSAELFYDAGEPLRAAELFSRFSDTASTARQADALALAGRIDSARALWITLINAGNAGIKTRSLYNLAATAAAPGEALTYLERLLADAPEDALGIIAYTRLLESPRALAILEGTALSRSDPLLDLELLRRRDTLPMDRMIPETWLLIERHSEALPLYEWGCYYFDRQRRYDEARILIRNAALRGLDSPRLRLHQGLVFIREGRLDEAEGLLQSIPREDRIWQVNANIARLLEARRSVSAALEYYEIASAQIPPEPEKGGPEGALLQLRIARCLRNLDRERESRRVLEYALTLDPENLQVRMELERLDQRGIF